MSNYQRLISYIYAYEGEIKGKNVGFAKLETRNGQCRITVRVKKIYVGGNPIGVYLLSDKGETKVGTLFVRNGDGEFQAVVNASNVENTSMGIQQFYGLSVHDVDSSWQSYTTIWEDAVAHAAELELEHVTSESRESQNEEKEGEKLPISKEIEREVEEDKEEVTDSPAQPPEPVHSSIPIPVSQEPAVEIPAVETPVAETPAVEVPPAPPEPKTEEPLQDPAFLNALDEKDEEGRYDGHQQVWDRFKKMYPKIQAFDYDHGCEILTIKPQDIGLLPREAWAYGNNSFLLHGYYNYRYLILARLGSEKGNPRYLLGIPGHYYSNEKYMANMFGFPNFVLSKNQPPQDERFGYWYTDVRVGE